MRYLRYLGNVRPGSRFWRTALEPVRKRRNFCYLVRNVFRRQHNDNRGTPNSETDGYHETITAAYVQLIAAHLARFEGQVPLESCVAALLESPLARREALLQFWSRARLMSPQARAQWVEPDLAPLPE